MDEHGAVLDDKVTFTPERDAHLETPHMMVRIDSECEKVETLVLVPVSPHGLQTEQIMGKGESDCEKVQGLVLASPRGCGLSLETNTLKYKPGRMRRRKHGCRAREILFGQMQLDNFAHDSVGYKVMSRLLAKQTPKGYMKI